jgi:hypothetical protein
VTSTVPATKPEPVRLFGSIVSGLAFIAGGLGAIFPSNPTVQVSCAVGTLCIGAINLATTTYVRGQVIPAADVKAYVNEDRQVIAGPAANVPVGRAGDPADLSPLDRLDGVGNDKRNPDIDDSL